jgi:hypothetical protein
MASNEGIGSPFPKQPSASSPKLRIYQSLFPLNEGVDHVITLLHNMGKFPFADKESVQCTIVEIEGVRCEMNAVITEHLADSERFDEGFWKQRREFEKKWRDPDDVYIDVERREEERKKQGLPPRLGVLSNSAVAEEEQRWEAEQERTKEPPKKRGK